MASSLRELRQRRKSVTATKKITKAMELIAASKVIRAQQAARRALPYTRELNRAVSALATHTRNLDHPLTTQVEKPRRAALVVFTSDRGMNGAFNSNVLKVAAQMRTRLEDQGMEVKRYVVGRKGMAYMKFRQIEMVRTWEGFSDAPTFANAHEIAAVLIEDFLTPHEEGGVDEIHAVYTRMESMLTQTPRVRRLLPMEVVEGVAELGERDHIPQYEFEPDPKTVLDELMPLYVRSRVWFYLLQTAASILASQQRAMKSATDNAQQLIESLTREANQARQAEITQEITEIVGGASALAEASAEH
ncbi:F0F1 ATP synthase subunit gamma [Propioniciclava sp. MC1595]|uniref:F0F1 ATP synthase subunit gamma n=1 Tax=Propioniciclava sp. MC1595 TaxID=2760308 RepID=UPI0016621DE2|nr:F0F1 ATP synthase subunit gamma [Propioniciclava sp. MC1595]MBB1495296.1 F0F1 ATP synthase subunit gamma [Propioniciclava sp. MC1595]QTE24750.1 F0F1 ATP synthase subunit gamma [Propioniciclava sp. MC1595]